VVRERQVKFLEGFYNDDLKCFQHSSTANQRVSISSTCLGISAMFKNSDLWAGYASPAASAKYCLTDVRNALSGHWRREPLFAPLLLITMMRLGEPAASKIMVSTLAQTVLLLGCTVGIEPDRLASSVQLYAGAPRACRFFHGDRPAHPSCPNTAPWTDSDKETIPTRIQA
jgi:hypothetical protein